MRHTGAGGMFIGTALARCWPGSAGCLRAVLRGGIGSSTDTRTRVCSGSSTFRPLRSR
ncbi:hypothetical protein [Amycolatopsis bartoniae]|uniref:hypothetical protein n=1 Tax=Amycolatopsis bartoniae TaxID=941986 RepID=UPI0016062316|nr:hypothetical protein [Amycolatopsis bartoniae]